MKRRITLSIALVVSVVLLSLMISDSTANAQQRVRRLSFDTGVANLGPGQVLRVAITGDGVDADDVIRVRFRRMGYIEQDNIYRVASQAITDPVTLAPSEAASFDIRQGEFNAVRGIVSGNFIGTNVRAPRATVQIIEEATGEVNSILIAILLP